MKDILTIVFWIFLVIGSLLGIVAVYLFFHDNVKEIAREMKLFSKDKGQVRLFSFFMNTSGKKKEKREKNHHQSLKKNKTFEQHLESIQNEKEDDKDNEEFLETQYMGAVKVEEEQTTFIHEDQDEGGYDTGVDMETMSTTYIGQEDTENLDTTYISEEDVENMATTYVGGSEKKRNGFEEFIIEQEEAVKQGMKR